MIKTVITDMDGTLLGRDGCVSPASRRAVRRLKDRGIRFLVCTGRTFSEARSVLEPAGICCDMICMNGAAAYRKDGSLLWKHIIDRQAVSDILAVAAEKGIVVQLTTDQGDYITGDRQEFEDFFCTYIFPYCGVAKDRYGEALKEYRLVQREEFLRQNIGCCKIAVLSSRKELLEQTGPALKNVEGVSVSSSYSTNWEITHWEADKGQALQEYAAREGLKLCEVMAIGDGDNDVFMLSLPLGYSVAMGNGTEKARAAASIVTAGNDEDGFAKAIERLEQEETGDEAREGLV